MSEYLANFWSKRKDQFKNYLPILLLIILTISLLFNFAAIARSFARETKPDTLAVITQKQLNDQSILALNWVQQSGEYQALAYQAFNLAKIDFDRAIDAAVEYPAVILDIDETLLNNSPYQAGLVDTNFGYTPASWNDWVGVAQAQAIPGAVEFANYVNSQGGKVFFISNRVETSSQNRQNNDLELATISNLQAVGFTGVEEDTVILKGEFSRSIDGQENTSKQFRREAVENVDADGAKHQIVVLVGDNLNDFLAVTRESNEVRRQVVKAHQEQFGVFVSNNALQNPKPAYIILPNPLYGYWESALYNPAEFGKEKWYQLTPTEKNHQRQQALMRWEIFYNKGMKGKR